MQDLIMHSFSVKCHSFMKVCKVQSDFEFKTGHCEQQIQVASKLVTRH